MYILLIKISFKFDQLLKKQNYPDFSCAETNSVVGFKQEKTTKSMKAKLKKGNFLKCKCCRISFIEKKSNFYEISLENN